MPRRRNKGFLSVDYEALLDSSLKLGACLPAYHPARLVVSVIERLDLSRLYARNPAVAHEVYAPQVMLGLLIYGYATGMFDAREMEKATYESIPFLFVAGGLHPDHRSIARFAQRYRGEIEELFVQVLVFSRAAGVLRLGQIDLNRPGVYVERAEGRAPSYERLLALKKSFRDQVSALLARSEQEGQQERPRELVVEDEAVFRADPLAVLEEAKTALQICLRQQYAGGEAMPEKRPERSVTATPSRSVPPERPSIQEFAVSSALPSTRVDNGNHANPSNGRETVDRFPYNCRTCRIRKQCIDSKMLGPGAKMAIRQMFENHTDTVDTWAKLQHDCLLAHRDQLQAASRQRPLSNLSQRLGKTRSPAPAGPMVEASKAPAPSAAPLSTAPEPINQDSGQTFGLIFVDTERMVRLPLAGEIVLGRFEQGFANPPDVDLAFDDGLNPSVSRRHACVAADEGGHFIEDLGSVNGTFLNGFPLALGERARLRPGDRIMLGRCRLAYSPLPGWAQEPEPSRPHLPVLTITHTGQDFELMDQELIVLGRADLSLDHIPDVDLSVAGEIAHSVSRRHAFIVTRAGRHYLQSAGSATPVSVNGTPLRLGDPSVLLYPGDQVSLGGCVLAYEWRLIDEREVQAHTFPPSLLNRLERHSLGQSAAAQAQTG